MGLRIRTNIASVNAQRRLSNSTQDLQDSMSKLASGRRINKASDDAAGLAVSENLRADIRSLNMAKRNASDGISIVQTAEGGLEETSNMLIRLRELAIQSASDTIGDTERGFLDKEYVQLKEEIDRLAASTEFNGTRLLVGKSDISDEIKGSGNGFPLEIQVGKDWFQNADAMDQSNPVNIIKIDTSMLNAFTEGDGSLEIGKGEEGTRVNNKEASQQSISTLDSAITRVNEYRAYLGAIQNRLNSTVSNLGTQTENLTESRSRVMDTDFAEETAKMTQANILQQAGASVLSNANVQGQIALKLLG